MAASVTAGLVALASFVVLGGFAAWLIYESSDADRQRVLLAPWRVRAARVRELNRKINAALRATAAATEQATGSLRRFAEAYRKPAS